MPPETSDEENLQRLPQDGQPPFTAAEPSAASAADDLDRATASSSLDATHQATDTNLDPHELYDEGVSGAAEAEEPNAGNAVTSYTPPEDDLVV